MDRKKIVIVSRTIYPFNSPRSHRATELAKELARQGHDVTLYGVLGSYNYEEFEHEFSLKVRAIEGLIFSTLSSDGSKKPSTLVKIGAKLFNKLLEFPDIELAFKMEKIIRNESNTDLIVSVAVPYPLHWGLAWVRYKFPSIFPKIWVADCGDPYMGNKFKNRPFYFKYIERWFCEKCDYITVPVEEAKSGYYPEFRNKIKVIPQGFRLDEVKIPEFRNDNSVITFIYAGTFYEGIRDPTALLEYLSALEIPFIFKVFTKNKKFLKPYEEKLKNKLFIYDYIPRKDLLIEMSQADFLINFSNGTEVQSPSKLIDYALVNRPILEIKPNILEIGDVRDFLNKNYQNGMKFGEIAQYDIKNIAGEFLKLN